MPAAGMLLGIRCIRVVQDIPYHACTYVTATVYHKRSNVLATPFLYMVQPRTEHNNHKKEINNTNIGYNTARTDIPTTARYITWVHCLLYTTTMQVFRSTHRIYCTHLQSVRGFPCASGYMY